MIAIVIVAAVLLLFFVVRPVLKQVVGRQSENRWNRILSNPDSDDIFLYSFNIDCFTCTVSEVLKPLRVDYAKFMSNLIYLAQGGSDFRMKRDALLCPYRVRTRSVHKFASAAKRPNGMPIWFTAAFPDVVDWLNAGGHEKNVVLYECIDEELLETALEDYRESPEQIEVFRRMIENYLRKVKPHLETQAP